MDKNPANIYGLEFNKDGFLSPRSIINNDSSSLTDQDQDEPL